MAHGGEPSLADPLRQLRIALAVVPHDAETSPTVRPRCTGRWPTQRGVLQRLLQALAAATQAARRGSCSVRRGAERHSPLARPSARVTVTQGRGCGRRAAGAGARGGGGAGRAGAKTKARSAARAPARPATSPRGRRAAAAAAAAHFSREHSPCPPRRRRVAAPAGRAARSAAAAARWWYRGRGRPAPRTPARRARAA